MIVKRITEAVLYALAEQRFGRVVREWRLIYIAGIGLGLGR